MHMLLHAATRFSLCAALVVYGELAVRPLCAQLSFTPASEFPGGGFRGTPNAISGDGSTIVGLTTSANGREAFRWNAATGMLLLGDLPGARFDSSAHGVSHNGSVVAGFSEVRNLLYGTGGGGVEAFRWSAETGMVGLGALHSWSSARATSADGEVVVGYGYGTVAFRWAQADGMSEVGFRPEPVWLNTSWAMDVSADGTVIVGTFRDPAGKAEAFRWTDADGMKLLGSGSSASGVSDDGRVVIGYQGPNGAARWTADEGWLQIASSRSEAMGISADGSVIVGKNRVGDLGFAFLWSPSTGSVDLRDHLLNHGVVEVQDWQLSNAIGISADCKTILGVGINPLGQAEPWIATIPEPSTSLLAVLASLGILVLCLRRGAWRSRFIVAIAMICALSVPQSATAQWSFTPLGDLPGRDYVSYATAVSADGSVVVGYSESANPMEAFRWTAQTGMVGLGDLRGGGGRSHAFRVSDDGLTIVGDSMWPTPPGTVGWGPQAFHWTSKTGMVGLGFLPGNGWSTALAASSDGSVIVGYCDTTLAPYPEAFRWTAAEGMTEVGQRTPGGVSRAADVSADGSVVVGTSDNEAFRWTAKKGAMFLGPGTSAVAVSSDGSIVLGHTSNGAAYWTEDQGWTEVGAANTSALAAAEDGSLIIVGYAGYTRLGIQVWTPALGLLNSRDYLLAQGIDNVHGWTDIRATDVSADGQTIVGHGINAQGQREAWIATIPEPSSVVLACLAAVLLVLAKAMRWRTERPTYQTISNPSDKP